MTTVRLDGENINVVYAHNIWTDNRINGLVASVALAALLAFVGACLVWPVKDLEFSSIGWWMIGTAGLIAAVETTVFIALIKQSRPSILLDKGQFSNLDYFKANEHAFNYSQFNENGGSYIMFLIKEGTKKQLRVFIENEISGEYLKNLGKKHKWVLPAQV